MSGNPALYDAFDQSVRMAPACFGLPEAITDRNGQ